MVHHLVPLIFILCAFSLHAESTRFGALGRNDTVVTKESDPIASAAIASETSARQSAVTDLTNKINAESAARTQALSSVETRLEVLDAKKQNAVVAFASVENTGVDVDDTNATSALENMGDISWLKGSLTEFGLGDRAVEPSAITLFRRVGTTTNQTASRILRILRWNGSTWFVAYQAESPVVHDNITINGGRIEHQMEYVAGSVRIPADETIVLCYAPEKSSPVTAVLNFGAKVITTTGTPRYLATGQSSIPASPSTAGGWPRVLAMEVTVREYKDAIATLASRVEAVAASAESAQGVAESASATAAAAVATADSAKAAASSASNAADGARVIAQAATTTAQSARATAESALAKVVSVEKTANAAATASDVATLSDRVTALEGRPSGDASGLSERVAAVEASVSTASETATAASAAAASASTTADSAKTTATAASATADSAKATASTAQALAESAASAAERAQTSASEASATASAAMAKASTVEKTANAAATAASVATLSDRVTTLENRPSGGVSDADLAAETSARKSADADLSARIESVANNAAGKATVATLQTQVATLQSDVSDNVTAISAAQKTASDAAAGVATAQSKANTAATDAATALTRANAAEVTASTAATNAANAVAAATAAQETADEALAKSSVGEEALAAAEAATLAAESAESNAQKAITNASTAKTNANTALSTANAVQNNLNSHSRYDMTRQAVNDNSYDSQGGSDYGHLYTTTPLYFRKDSLGTFNAPLMVALSTGLMLEETPKSSHHGAAIALDPTSASKALGLGEVGHVTSTAWVSPGDWAITVTPAEELTTITNESVVSTNDVGQVIGSATVAETVSQAKAVAVELVDTTATAAALPTMTWTCEGASLTVATDTLSAQVSSETPGTYRVVAAGADGRSRDAYVSLRAQSKTFSQQTTYMSDTAGTARAAANDAILAALQKRDTSSTVASGITSAVCTTDLCFSDYGNNPVASAPLDPVFYCCVEPTSSWGPDAVAVAPHFAVTAAHRNPPQAHTASFRTPDGKGAGIRGTDGFALAQWARENGYSESEIREASLGDIWVWHLLWTVDNVNISTSIPDGCIPYFLDRSGWDYYYGSNLYGIACYAVTQNRYLSWSAFTRDDGAGWAEFGGTYRDANDNEMVMRSDLRALLSPAKCARIYGGDSGRPVMMIHDNKPVLISTFHTARGGPSYIKACDILDACIKQLSSGKESLKRISAPVAESEQ